MKYLTVLALNFALAWGDFINESPIVGVFSQPSTSSKGNCKGDCLYIAASYVKFLESAGARVVPINYYATNEQLDDIFPKLNGFFLTGGGSEFPQSAQYIFDLTVKANNNGDFAPLWGTCMGFEWLLISATRDEGILDGVMDAENLSIPLEFTSETSTSKMFAQAPTEILKILETENVTMNNHHYGIWTDHFKATESLSSFFNPLSLNKDRTGMEFISTMEAFNYPIYGVQWHPEKNTYEWYKENGIPYESINHSPHAIAIEQYMANFFVQETRKSNHKFTNPEEEESLLIYNWDKTKTGPSFVESYFFPNDF